MTCGFLQGSPLLVHSQHPKSHSLLSHPYATPKMGCPGKWKHGPKPAVHILLVKFISGYQAPKTGCPGKWKHGPKPAVFWWLRILPSGPGRILRCERSHPENPHTPRSSWTPRWPRCAGRSPPSPQAPIPVVSFVFNIII